MINYLQTFCLGDPFLVVVAVAVYIVRGLRCLLAGSADGDCVRGGGAVDRRF